MTDTRTYFIDTFTLTHGVQADPATHDRRTHQVVAGYNDQPVEGVWEDWRNLVRESAVAHTLEIGQPVQVHAFGNWREGTVTAFGRTKVTVEYVRNQSGTKASRAFPAHEVRTV